MQRLKIVCPVKGITSGMACIPGNTEHAVCTDCINVAPLRG
jgi:hypothetical protein